MRNMETNRRWRAAEYQRNKAIHIALSLAYYTKNKVNILEKARIYRKRERVGKVDADRLTDRYVCHLLCYGTVLSRKHIPPQLIDCKRVEIQIKRKLKELCQNQRL